MNYGEMNNYITHISDNDMVALCKSIYEYKNGNGVLEPTSTPQDFIRKFTASRCESVGICHYGRSA